MYRLACNYLQLPSSKLPPKLLKFLVRLEPRLLRGMRMLSFSALYRISLFLLSLLATCPGRLYSQASPTASKNTEYSVFGTYSLASPDNRNAGKNSGFTFGADYTHLFPRNFALSVEPRVKIVPGEIVSEHTYGAAIRFEYRIHSFAPYVDCNFSYGVITLTHPTDHYRTDNSIVTSPGFGLDYRLTPQWSARFDYQFEHWNLADNTAFDPRAASFGVVYRFPFRPYKPR